MCFHRYSQSFLFPIFHKKIEDEDSLLVPVFKWVSSTKVLAPQPTPLIHFNTLGCITQEFLKIIDKSWQADMKTNKHKVNGQVEWFGIIDKKKCRLQNIGQIKRFMLKKVKNRVSMIRKDVRPVADPPCVNNLEPCVEKHLKGRANFVKKKRKTHQGNNFNQ